MVEQAIITVGNKEWQITLATAPWELAQGLGGIPELPSGAGMFFDTGWEQTIRVTTIPIRFSLDIAFLSEAMVVTEVYLDVQPGYLVTSTLPARHFLEVNAGELYGIDSGDRAVVEVLPTVQVSAVPDWASAVVSLMGMMIFGAVMVSFVTDMMKEMLEEPKKKPLYGPKGERLLPQTSNKSAKPTRYDVTVEAWQERDRLGIWITDKRIDKTIAEWWDEDAQEMFEQGFFKRGVPQRAREKPGRELVESVLDYAESVGLLAGSGKYLPQTVRDACYWTAFNKDTGEITESYTPYISSGRALRGGKAFVSRHWRGLALVEVWKQPGRYSEGFKIEPVASERVALGPSPAVMPTRPERPHASGELEYLADRAESFPVARLLQKWSKAKARNSALALKDLEALGPDYDVEECQELLHDYRDIDRSDYDDQEEYQEARDEVWEAFLECLESLAGEEEAMVEQEVSGRESSPGHGEKATSEPRVKPQLQKETTLEYLADSPEFLAYTIEDIGYRDKLDNAFQEAIARARRAHDLTERITNGGDAGK